MARILDFTNCSFPSRTHFMADYDSDSSDDGQVLAATNVLLGYASKEPTEDFVSHLGGKPVREIDPLFL